MGIFLSGRILLYPFPNFMAQGLPMCHILQVSGSSLPVSISIDRGNDHINLQAEVFVSGIEVPPIWSDVNRRR